MANCETVEGAGSNGGRSGSLKVTIGSAKLAAVAAKGLKLKVACSAACSATGTMKLGAKKIGAGKGKAAKAGTATVTIKIAKKYVRKLKRLKSAKTTVKVSVKQGGKTQTVSRSVTLKR